MQTRTELLTAVHENMSLGMHMLMYTERGADASTGGLRLHKKVHDAIIHLISQRFH